MKTKGQRSNVVLPVAALLLLAVRAALGQGLIQAECRIDGGAAQAMTLVATNSHTNYFEGTFTAAVTATNLSIGAHWLDVRMKGTNDVWCEWQGQWFRIAGQPNLVAAEWFVDADPGAGLGAPISLPEDGAWDEPEEDFVVSGVNVTNLSVGHHSLVIRCKDLDGNWGITSATTFYVAEPVYIAAAEWTTNALADAGTGYPILATDGAFDEADEDVMADPNSALAGTTCCVTNTLYVRVKDSLGRWSTRGGLSWNVASNSWVFDPALGWSTASRGYLRLAPEIATAVFPASGAVILSNNLAIKLDWNDPVGATKYDVYFWPDGSTPNQLLAGNWTPSQVNLPPPTIARYVTNNWRIRAIGTASDCYSDSPVWRFVMSNVGDSEADHMPDSWETNQFGSSLYADMTTDYDRDGTPDWQEFIAGTSPTDWLDQFRIETIRKIVSPAGVALDWNTITGRTYTVLFSTNHSFWTSVGGKSGTGGMVSYTNSAASGMGFFRLGITYPPWN